MTVQELDPVDLATSAGPMRTYRFRPAAEGSYPGILLFSEIFQLTGPIRRIAVNLASHGYVVAAPEIYHEFEPAGTVLGYDPAGSGRGNDLKTTKDIASYDADARAVLDHLRSLDFCTGKLGVFGVCIGGHLAFRAAMNPEVRAAACFYATDIHASSLGKGKQDNSLERVPEIKAEILMIWGRQDPHIPLEGRLKIHARLEECGTNFQWIEVNGAHAFLRDEGPRHDPDLASLCHQFVFELFHRRLS